MARYIKDYLSFSRSEKNALIIFAISFILIILLNIFLPFIVTPERNLTATQLLEIKRIQKILNDSSKSYDSNSYQKGLKKTDYFQNNQQDIEKENQILFIFDPNEISIDGWRKLHLSEKTISNIEKYRQKGGRFYKPEDLRKIYGLSEKLFEKLEPYIIIKANEKKSFTTNKSFTTYDKYKNPIIQSIELNSATEADLDKLPSIGVSYAKRILKYRELLGGYFNKEQLLEVYGIDSGLYNKIKGSVTVDQSKIVKISINLSEISQMGKHPYIGFKIARIIIDSRNTKGSYKKVLEVKETIGNESYNRLYPYLKLWD